MFFLEGVTTAAPPEYINYLLCKEFGWSYKELQEMPRTFVEQMLAVMGIKQKYDLKRHGRH